MMKSAKSKRQLTLLTLVLALGVAVYLNWEYAKTDTGFQLADGSAAVNAPVTEQLEGSTPVQTTEDGVPVQTAQSGVPVQTTEDGTPVQNAQSGVTEALPDKNYGEAQLVSAGESTSDKYFEQARLTRSKTRDEALDKLQKSLKSANLSKEEKTQLTQNLSSTLESITVESDIENLVKAKGFADCVAFLNGDKANLAVKTGGAALDSASVAQLRDIVLSKLETEAKNITIVEVK